MSPPPLRLTRAIVPGELREDFAVFLKLVGALGPTVVLRELRGEIVAECAGVVLCRCRPRPTEVQVLLGRDGEEAIRCRTYEHLIKVLEHLLLQHSPPLPLPG